ncbi:ethanolamine ammonia-lyase reactivating factor EutA [Halalkalibacterium ligniniphilum]|uniref:ethanolamine ammonia-lyase reactivating factor EutA n=1 Tax=Halalkalibacterium ligniniphilum TaxID=1134413 RepID=UPI0003498145|nr:ethanolamine ammonia-lyase reactivating factor EutA [Halalkalibacterium ligniniphilum]
MVKKEKDLIKIIQVDELETQQLHYYDGHHHHHHDHNDAHHHDHDHSHHDHEHSHGHHHGDHEGVELNPRKNGLWLADNIEFTSVGIDIGSAGTQVIFSNLSLRRIGEALSSRYVVIQRESFYRSPVRLTPYLDEKKIDDQKISQYIDEAYKESGVEANTIDTGAVILTGEAMRRENSRAIAEVLSDKGGGFVCATAGHNMEALLAAYGSGAAKKSYLDQTCLLNIDIGGGTTKLAIVENGKVLETGAIYIGGRLLVVDEEQKIVRLDPGGVEIAKKVGLILKKGDVVTEEQLQKMTNWMAHAIFKVITEKQLPQELNSLYLTEKLTQFKKIKGIIFSGGVGEYVYEREERDFGDLGKRLGKAIRKILLDEPFTYKLYDAKECIRATVIGASEHSVQVSGNTIFVTDMDLLPQRNLQVLRPDYLLEERIDPEKLAQSIKEHFTRFDLTEGEKEVVLALSWTGKPEYQRICLLAEGIKRGLAETIKSGKAIYIVLDGDIANTLGYIIKEELGFLENDVIVVDGIVLKDFDFIDIGKVLYPSGTVPVTIKSLIFEM